MASANDHLAEKSQDREPFVSKDVIAFLTAGSLVDEDKSSISIDIFDGALWRRKMSENADNGEISVTLSSGKSIIVNSKFLGLLRVLAEELAKEETPLQ